MGSKKVRVIALLVVLVFECYYWEKGHSTTVTYDHKALVIDGKRQILQSGSIHYPRSTPEMWPDIIKKSKEGGLDVIETYVFWNYHEPVKGKYYFEGRFDLVRFVKTVQEAGLLVHLRIGPYACAEWNYGFVSITCFLFVMLGFPVWLHFIPGIQFRTTNNLFKDENLFASKGGPIILVQVENEYGNIEGSYGVGGELYVKWAAETAVNLNMTVPWVTKIYLPINTCNGFYCERFSPNSPSKPKMWTENYSGWFLAFGNAIPYRPVEDLAFAVARFFETGGTFQNYYMNFRTTLQVPEDVHLVKFTICRFYAFIYFLMAEILYLGYIRQPKWSHLRDLHKAIKLCEEHLISSDPIQVQLGTNLEAHIYSKTSNDCAAFLANYDSSLDANVTFNGNSYFLAAWSVSILPDCKNVIFNTAKVVAQRNLQVISSAHSVNELLRAPSAWSWYKEKVGIWSNNSFVESGLLEHIDTTKDTSDYLWYTTSINVEEDIMPGKEKDYLLHIESLGHAALVFVNKRLQGFGYGNHEDESFNLTKKITFHHGNNTLDVLSMMIGLQVGLEGEYVGLDKISLANGSLWTQGTALPVNHSLIWYKVIFLAPEGKGPLALNLASMGKGQAWVNGQSIGRYWTVYLSPSTGCTDNCDYRGTYDPYKCLMDCGQPAQTLYHIPRTWVHLGENLLVLHEELGGDPSKISLLTRTGQEICAHVSEVDPPPADSWKPNQVFNSQILEVRLNCEQGWHFNMINFASFGTPRGNCGTLISPRICHVNVTSIVQQCFGSGVITSDKANIEGKDKGKSDAYIKSIDSSW
uniref:Beta-galactosidase n=1 Tax=Quercus lobata TaxID=97700 RepID=A0A7N2LSV3_QUELO